MDEKKISDSTPVPTHAHPAHTPRTPTPRTPTPRTPTPRTYDGKEYYCASDVAEIIGVDRSRVVRWNNELWHGAQCFTADLKTHDGVYLYEIERVMQLKSVYHKNWKRGGYGDFSKPNQSVSLDSVIEQIKLLDPAVLEAQGIVQRARKNGYICPFCRDGTGRDGTGMSTKSLNGRQSWYCGKCAKAYDNIDLLAAHLGKDIKHDFKEIVQIAADLFNFHLDEPLNQVAAVDKPAVPDKYKAFITNANSRLKAFVDTQGGSWRGLTFDTLNRYRCGYAVCYGMKGEPSLPHVIVPTSFNQYLARLIGSPDDYPEANGININPKPHHGSKELFGLKLALNDDPIIILVEGEFDAMSIWQASGFNVIAICGSALVDKMRDQIKNIGIKNFIVLLDNDTTGRDKAQLVVNALNFCGHRAASFILSDTFKDANDFLQADPEAFAARLKEIYSEAQNIFKADDDFDDLIAQWQENNYGAPIDEKIIADLKDARLFVDNLTPENFSANLAFDISVRHKVALCKFYIPLLAQKFFGILKDAQKAAALTIKNSKDQNDITPELTELARLKPAEIENAINEFATQIKREQKNFQKQFQKELDRKALEEKKTAILDSQLSTKKIIPDCPIDLFIPDSVYFNKRGVGTQSFDKRGNLLTDSAAFTPIVPVKILREPSKHITQYEIAIKAKGFWRHIEIFGDELADPRKILRLAKDGGAIIENPRALTQFFAKIIAANEDRLIETKCYQQPGWHGDKFIYPTGSDDYIVRRANIDYKELFATKGDPDLWKKKFDEIFCSARDVPNQGNFKRATLGAFCLPPMLRFLHLPNFWLHLQGRLNFAKTPLIKFGLSIYGNPAETYLLRSFDSSPKNRVTMAVGFNDLPQALDELETLSPKEFTELQKSVYDYCSGMDGQKNQRSGDVRQTIRFRGVRISSGERPVLDQTAKGGALKRCITLHIVAPFFNDAEARQLHIFCEKNHGHFGKAWTKYVDEHQEEISADFEKVFAATHEQTSDSAPAHIRAIVGCSVAAWHFRLFLGLEKKFERELARSDACTTLHALPTQDEISDVKRGINLLASWLDEHPKNFITETDSGEFISAVNFAETSGIKFADGRVAIFPNAFRRICEKELQLPSYEKFLNELFDDGHLICPSRREKAKQTWIKNEKKRVYLFKAGILTNIDEPDDENFSIDEYKN